MHHRIALLVVDGRQAQKPIQRVSDTVGIQNGHDGWQYDSSVSFVQRYGAARFGLHDLVERVVPAGSLRPDERGTSFIGF
jgi:hypothetical protein